MLDFLNWCSVKTLPLPTTQENNTRTGVKAQYPDGYVRSQYPDAYFAPTSATAYLDLKNSKKTRSVKGWKLKAYKIKNLISPFFYVVMTIGFEGSCWQIWNDPDMCLSTLLSLSFLDTLLLSSFRTSGHLSQYPQWSSLVGWE